LADGPSPGEGLVRVVRLMLAHGRVVVTMLMGDKKRRSVPSERECAMIAMTSIAVIG
jgi:hypothetical protein